MKVRIKHPTHCLKKAERILNGLNFSTNSSNYKKKTYKVFFITHYLFFNATVS